MCVYLPHYDSYYTICSIVYMYYPCIYITHSTLFIVPKIIKCVLIMCLLFLPLSDSFRNLCMYLYVCWLISYILTYLYYTYVCIMPSPLYMYIYYNTMYHWFTTQNYFLQCTTIYTIQYTSIVNPSLFLLFVIHFCVYVPLFLIFKRQRKRRRHNIKYKVTLLFKYLVKYFTSQKSSTSQSHSHTTHKTTYRTMGLNF